MALRDRRGAARQARRILLAQIRKALDELGGRNASDEDIHDARKNIKKARATLRLLHEAVPRSAYRRENRLLRDAGRPLSVARDTKVLVDACDGLLRRYLTARRIAGVQRLRRRLVLSRNQVRRRVLGSAGGLRRSRKLLRQSRRVAADFSLAHAGWSELAQGAARVYAAGCAAFEEARLEPTVERLHEWRKQAKHLYYQLQLLAPLCRAEIGRLARELGMLSDELGEDHDLAVLLRSVAAYSGEFAEQAGASALKALIERARGALQRKALRRGASVYRELPAQFMRRLHRQ